MASTSARSSVRSSGVGVRLLVAVSALVLGILGMHALTSPQMLHGGAAATTHAGPSTTTGAAAAEAGDSSVPDAAAEDDLEPHRAAVTHLPMAPDGHSSTGMLMLCAAMLAGAALLLLTVLVRGRAPWVRLRLPVDVRRCSPTLGSLVGSGPPAVWRFSVIRC